MPNERVEKIRGIPSYVQSLNYWRDRLGRDLEYTKRTPCKYCDGVGFYHNVWGDVRCICSIMDGERIAKYRSYQRYAAIMPKRNDVDFDWSWPPSEKWKTALGDMQQHAMDFARWPDRWLTITGKAGTGKSHMLQWVAQQYGIFALYMTEERYKDLVYAVLDENQGLTRLHRAMKSIPVLLYDDLGAGYTEKSNYSGDQLRSVFSYRYEMYRSYPTMVTTNMKLLTLFDPRLGDRLMDNRFIFHDLGDCPSWRTTDK